jgi:cytochrome P450
MQIINKKLEEHIDKFDPDNIDDMLDVLVEKVKNTSDPDSSFYKNRGLMNIVSGVTDLFAGGSQTVSTAITWSVLYMLHHPDVQEKMFQEIVEVKEGRTKCYIRQHKNNKHGNKHRLVTNTKLFLRHVNPGSQWSSKMLLHLLLISVTKPLIRTRFPRIDFNRLFAWMTIVEIIRQISLNPRLFIFQVVGLDRLPSLEDRNQMDYCNAVIDETLRRTGMAYAIPHSTNTSFELEGYTIPKGTIILGHLHYILNDPNYWKEPRRFNPERFLDSEGKFHHDERVIPFSTGKRFCLGQSLAEKELFLFLTGLIQTFRFKSPVGEKLASYQEEFTLANGLLRPAPHFMVELELR